MSVLRWRLAAHHCVAEGDFIFTIKSRVPHPMRPSRRGGIEKAGLVTRLRFIKLVVGFLDDDDDKASFDAALGNADTASLDVRFDFHTTILLMNLDVKHSAASPYSRL